MTRFWQIFRRAKTLVFWFSAILRQVRSWFCAHVCGAYMLPLAREVTLVFRERTKSLENENVYGLVAFRTRVASSVFGWRPVHAAFRGQANALER